MKPPDCMTLTLVGTRWEGRGSVRLDGSPTSIDMRPFAVEYAVTHHYEACVDPERHGHFGRTEDRS